MIRSFLRQFTTLESRNAIDKVGFLLAEGHLDDALSLFYTLPPPHSPHTYAAFFLSCARHRRHTLGRALHHHMLTHETNIAPDLYTINNLVNMYAKFGDFSIARQLFDQMPLRNIVSWTSLISGYSRHGHGDDCFSLFTDMLAHFKPNDFAYTSVLSVCNAFCGEQIHALVLKTGFDACVYVGNALINMYWKTKGDVFCENDENEDAWKVFHSMGFRNLVTWNSMMSGYQTGGQCDKAMNLFSSMGRNGVGCDRTTFLSLISCLCENIGSDLFSKLKCCFQLHCVVVKTSFDLDVAVATALVKAYSCLGGEAGDCFKLFRGTSGCRDVVLWTETIAAFVERDPVQALSFFIQLHREGLNLDCHAFSTVLKACGGLVIDKHALAVQCQVVKTGFANDIVLQNALIHAFARCGSIVKAIQVFDEMKARDAISWNSMLKAYALQGQAREALDLFGQMDVKPDAYTFVALLSACSHAGMVKEGSEIFDTMFERYGVVPQPDHFACIVDILGRAGHLLEAEQMITEMPMEPDYVIWSSFLGACRKHGDAKSADLCLSRMKELDPGNSQGYVLMANLHSSMGGYEEAGLTRMKMKGLGITKEPGLSWTEFGNQIHEFASGGRLHPQGEAIRLETKKLAELLKKMGYVPQTDMSLHDIEEEHKEEQLYYHSEKLALVFALVRSTTCLDDVNGSGSAIRIMKNIRICSDCHNFMKLASEFVQRDITVRDSNRFHNFSKGSCSCNDYCESLRRYASKRFDNADVSERLVLALSSCNDTSAKGWLTKAIDDSLDEQVCWKESLKTGLQRLFCLNKGVKPSPVLPDRETTPCTGSCSKKVQLLAANKKGYCFSTSTSKRLTSKESTEKGVFSPCKQDTVQMWELSRNGTLKSSYSGLCASIETVEVSGGIRSWLVTGIRGEIYLAFFNLNSQTTVISAKISDIGKALPRRRDLVVGAASCSFEEVWSGTKIVDVNDTVSISVTPHGSSLFTLYCR